MVYLSISWHQPALHCWWHGLVERNQDILDHLDGLEEASEELLSEDGEDGIDIGGGLRFGIAPNDLLNDSSLE